MYPHKLHSSAQFAVTIARLRRTVYLQLFLRLALFYAELII